MSFTETTGAAAGAVTVTLAASPNVLNSITFASVSYSGAASGPVTLTVNDGGTAVLVVDLSLAIGVPFVLTLPNGGIVSGAPGNAMSVVVSAGAASSVAKVSVGSLAIVG